MRWWEWQANKSFAKITSRNERKGKFGRWRSHPAKLIKGEERYKWKEKRFQPPTLWSENIRADSEEVALSPDRWSDFTATENKFFLSLWGRWILTLVAEKCWTNPPRTLCPTWFFEPANADKRQHAYSLNLQSFCIPRSLKWRQVALWLYERRADKIWEHVTNSEERSYVVWTDHELVRFAVEEILASCPPRQHHVQWRRTQLFMV